MATKHSVQHARLRVAKNDNSPTGYYIYSSKGGSGVPATNFEVRLWHMYCEALELARRLRKELDKLAQIKRDSVAEGEDILEANADE